MANKPRSEFAGVRWPQELKDQIIELNRAGHSNLEIFRLIQHPRITRLAQIQNFINHARHKKLDVLMHGRHTVPRDATRRTAIYLTEEQHAYLTAEGKARHMNAAGLCSELLSTICTHKMILAILDDGDKLGKDTSQS